MKPPPISAVIATLGGASLGPTIDRLKSGTLVPEEILICIPENLAARAANLKSDRVKIVPTPVRGQVAQRAYGFSLAAAPLVLQLDDDIDLDERCVELLASLLVEKGHRAAVGPSFFIKRTGAYAYPERPPTDSVPGLSHRILNGDKGFQPGRIAKSGFCFSFQYKSAPQETDWLPGGCVLHWKENLVLHDFYPYPGKAYAEDLFHSEILRRAGISLFMSGQARGFIDFPERDRAARLKDLFYEARAMQAFARFAGKEGWRLYLYYLLVLKNEIVDFAADCLRGVRRSARGEHV